jgi:hypothetical protein
MESAATNKSSRLIGPAERVSLISMRISCSAGAVSRTFSTASRPIKAVLLSYRKININIFTYIRRSCACYGTCVWIWWNDVSRTTLYDVRLALGFYDDGNATLLLRSIDRRYSVEINYPVSPETDFTRLIKIHNTTGENSTCRHVNIYRHMDI